MPKFTSTFVPNPAGIRHLTSSPTGTVGIWLRGLIEEIEIVAKANAPMKTGALRASIRSTVIPVGVGLVGEVSANTAYALFVHEGTAPHPIDGNPILRFPTNGMVVFTPHVDHPGTRANPFLRDALVFVVSRR